MCGILLSINNGHSVGNLTEAVESISHRGPDDTGMISGDWYAAGFKRLAVLDLSARGHQPMSNGKGLHVLHNGEVYNFREIRKELEDAGHSFVSETDTEVILKAFMEWGPACTEKMTGMYATAIIDSNNEQVHLFRDQLGVKPLYYFFAGGNRFFIASEPKSIKSFCDFEVDQEILEEFFIYRSIIGKKTLIKNLYTVLPGEYICISRNGGIETRSFQKTTARVPVPERYEEILDLTEEILKESISYQLISDVPVGLQLSGGVDSSLIAAMVQTHFPRQELNSFSISISESGFDESKYQKIVADTYGITHHEVPFNERDFCDLLEKAVWHSDFPPVQPNSVAILKLSGYAKQYVTVMLSGEGADETFLGYPKYQIVCNRKYIDVLLKYKALGYVLPPVWKFKTARRLVNGNKDFLDVFLKHQQFRAGNSSWLGDKPYRKRYEYVSNFGESPDFSIPYYDQASSLQVLLERFDRMTMSSSLEGRVPFCDHRLVRFANSIPLKHKAEAGSLKKILKKIGEKYLPHDLLYREKMGFSLPLAKWLANSKGFGRFKDLLYDREFREKGLIESSYLESLLLKQSYTPHEAENILWPLISYELWYRKFIKNGCKN